MTTIESSQETFEQGQVLLEAKNLKKYFPVTKGLLISKVLGISKQLTTSPSSYAQVKP